MLNSPTVPADDVLKVFEYDERTSKCMTNGRMNIGQEVVLNNIRSAIRRGHPQMRTAQLRHERICLVGSGPSLNETEDELRQLVYEGAILVTLNGAYHWCRERNLQPRTQIILDGRPTNSRFVTPYVPRCNYVLASQCAPEVWDAVAGYENVWIFHAAVKQETEISDILDEYYGGNWVGVVGGTTVASRAMMLLRYTGYLRFDLFGVDCCWMGDQHHAFPQPENESDKRTVFRVSSPDGSMERDFICTPWMVKQIEDFCQLFRVNGREFRVNVHGDGALAYVLQVLANTGDVETKLITEGA